MRAGPWIGFRGALACAAALFALGAWGAGSAVAAPPRTIAGYGSGGGEVWLPNGVAVDNSAGPGAGDLYVADRANYRIDKFDSAGGFLLAWGWGVADGRGQELQVCGPAAGHLSDRCFEAAREGTSVASGPGAVAPEAVAVDGSGNVWVADSINRRVSEFSPSGQFMLMAGREVDKTSGANICTAADLAGGDECGKGLSGSGPDQFAVPRSIGVDPAGHVWVGDTERLQEIEPGGAPGTEVSLSGGGETTALAIDASGDFYLKSASLPGIRKLHSDGTPYPTPYPIDEGGSPRTVAVDGSGRVFIGDCGAGGALNNCPAYAFKVYDPAGAQVSQFGAGQVIGVPGNQAGSNAIMVDETAKTLYVGSSRSGEDNSALQAFDIPPEGPLIEAQQAEGILPTSTILAASLSPEGEETTYRFQYGTSEAYGSETTLETLEEGGAPDEGFEESTVEAPLEGLLPDTTYHFRLCATNAAGSNCGPDTSFATRTAVGIEAQWASGVAAHDATLHAEFDPLGVSGKWWIEYGTSSAYGSATVKNELSAGFGAVPVEVLLSGLAPATTYHYRFAASDKREGTEYTVHGEERTFTTQLAGLGLTLPDDRAWEMVSPPDKHGARLRSASVGQVQAAADGTGIAYLSRGSVEASPEGSRSPEDTSVLGRRTGPGEWASKDITPPNEAVMSIITGPGLEYKLFSPDLSEALLEPRSGTRLSPQASERTPYLRQNTDPPTYTPLASGCPAAPEPCPAAVRDGADVPEGIEFGTDPTALPKYALSAVGVAGSSADLSHVVVRSTVPLVPGVCREVTPGTGRWDDNACSHEDSEHEGNWEGPQGALYEWTAGAPPAQRLEPISKLPPPEEGGEEEVVDASLGSAPVSVEGAVSEDGSRVFWSPLSGNALYVRDTAGGETARLDAVQEGAFGTGKAEPVLQGANPQGTVVLFTDSQNLTEDANEKGRDLYRCALLIEEGKLKCDLSDLSAGTASPFESAEVLGLTAGMSDAATSAYFVARGALAGANAEGRSPVPGQPNLYLWHQGEGVRFIATLSEEDRHDWGFLEPDAKPLAVQRSAAASPAGRYLAFMSELPLSGFDNRDVASGEADQEVFLYDAEANGGEGGLTCASCKPAAGRPRGLQGFEGGGLAPAYDPQQFWAGYAPASGGHVPARWLAATLPEATKIGVSGASLYRPRALHDNGRLFFNAADSLVSADSNGTWDVYEYEPTGTGDCTASSGGAGTARSGDGCVSLISSGTGEGESAFIDASVGGNDVFFWTNAQLLVSDLDHVTDVYDARVGGAPAVSHPQAECLGEACQPAASAPALQTPASAAFEGPGDLAPKARKRCPKGRRAVRRKGRTRCVARKHRRRRHRHHHRRHHRRHHKGRAHR